jgi:hypothetical protein
VVYEGIVRIDVKLVIVFCWFTGYEFMKMLEELFRGKIGRLGELTG